MMTYETGYDYNKNKWYLKVEDSIKYFVAEWLCLEAALKTGLPASRWDLITYRRKMRWTNI